MKRPVFHRAAAAPGTTDFDAEFHRLRRRLLIAVILLGTVTIVGIVGFSIIGGGRYSVVDAIYMTVITLTTVGFGEIIDMSHNPAARVFTMLLLLGGMGIVAYTVPAVAAFIIEGQLHHVFARRRMQTQITGMANHYVICGDTSASWHVAEELLRTRRPVVLIAPTEAAVTEAQHRLGAFPAVIGDSSLDDTLLAAGVERASGVVFAMQSDKDNVLGVLAARRLAPQARIVAATEEPETEIKLRTVGADAVVSPSRIGGLRMASELVRPVVVTFLDKMLRQKGGTLRVEEVTVPERLDVTGRTLDELRVNEIAGAILVAVRHPRGGDFEFKPAPDTPLAPGMTIVVMADADGLERLKTRFRSATGGYLAVGGETA